MKTFHVIVLAIALAASGCAGCGDTAAPITGTSGLKIDLIDPTPAMAGSASAANRLIYGNPSTSPGTVDAATVNITAYDETGAMDTTYTKTLQVYVFYLGTLTPYLGMKPIATVQVTNGVATNQKITLPPVFGPTTLWFDDGTSANPTYATGVSPTLWFRDPFIHDVQDNEADPSLTNELDVSPLDNKNIAVNTSRYAANGRLVVTSVYAQGYTIADVNCKDASGTPPCTAGDYDYLDIYSYSAAQDQNNCYLTEGQFIDGFAGGISDFDGLTEIGFPQTFVNATTPPGGRGSGSAGAMGDCAAATVDTTREPATPVFTTSWFTSPLNFEHNESGAIEIDNAYVCALDSDYTTYNQWKIDPVGMASPANCGGTNLINVITAGTLDFDPSTIVGQKLPKIVGILRPVQIGSFNVWIIYPRSMADLTLQ